MEFGKKLKAILEFEGIQQKDFAKLINIHPSTLSGYINEGKQPDFELLKTMAAALGVSIDYLLDYQPDPKSVSVSPKETAMLETFRALSKEKQEVLLSLMKLLSQN